MGALRRGLLRDALRRCVQLDRDAPGHGAAHRHPLHVQQEVRHDGLSTRLRCRSARDREGARHAQHQRRVMHDALRAVGGHRGAPRHAGARAADARSAARAPGRRVQARQRHPRHARRRAALDVLPVPRRHRHDGAHGLHRGRRLRRRRSAPDRRLVLHREHFGRRQPGEERQYIRLAYSGIDVADICDGLGRLRDWIEEA